MKVSIFPQRQPQSSRIYPLPEKKRTFDSDTTLEKIREKFGIGFPSGWRFYKKWKRQGDVVGGKSGSHYVARELGRVVHPHWLS
jgi:hypothetical protein